MKKLIMVCLTTLTVLAVGISHADWCETNKDGTSGGGLDYLDYWVASWNGSTPNPATNWYTDAELSGWFGTDPGWTGNIVNITDADATAYAAANKFESFFDVKATVSVSTTDLDEEFGLTVRASDFSHGDPITAVNAYAATFSANNALNTGEPMKFTLYKIVDGIVEYSEVANPLVPAEFDDLIVFIELTAIGNQITAKLFDDADSTSPLSTIDWQDNSSPLTSGYTGVINLDYDSADGISSYYDTLNSVVIPEPCSIVLLSLGSLLLRKRRA